MTPYTPSTLTAGQKPIQRTLVLTVGDRARSCIQHLPATFREDGSIGSAIGIVDVADERTEITDAIRKQLARVSRAANQIELGTQGYVLDRLQELALFLVVDLTDEADPSIVTKMLSVVTASARDGWGVDTSATLIALAADWSLAAARARLLTLARMTQGQVDALIALNRVNELGLELDDEGAYLRVTASILEALITTPLRDVVQLIRPLHEAFGETGHMTSVGISSWEWKPEYIQDRLANDWVLHVIRHWLAKGDESRQVIADQRSLTWCESQNILPQPMSSMLEESLQTLAVPTWSIPYPWNVAATVARFRSLADALGCNAPGITQLVLEDWHDWLIEQRARLRETVEATIDAEPVAGLDLAKHLLSGIGAKVQQAVNTEVEREDLLADSARGLAEAVAVVLSELEGVIVHWPGDSSLRGWIGLLLRPWRWTRFAWEYWTVHKLAQTSVQLLQNWSKLERELVLVQVAAELHKRYLQLVDQAASQLSEVEDMLGSRLQELDAINVSDMRTELGPFRSVEASEEEAARAAKQLGGLGSQIHFIDEALVDGLRQLGWDRFGYIADMSAAAGLGVLLADSQSATAWWQDRRLEATPLWLYDATSQREENHDDAHPVTVVCATDVEQLRDTLALGDVPDVRWLPMVDKRRILLTRWRAGVKISDGIVQSEVKE